MNVEQEIQDKGLTAPRVTPDDIEDNIQAEYYFNAGDAVMSSGVSNGLDSKCAFNSLKLLTFCVLVLKNGFTVTGESACASPANFNEQIGMRIARANAIQKVWPLMGYALKQRLSEGS